MVRMDSGKIDEPSLGAAYGFYAYNCYIHK